MKKLRGVEPNLYLSYSEGKGTLRYDYLPPQINDSENTSLHGIDPPEESLSSKFSPDERVLIEQLLHYVCCLSWTNSLVALVAAALDFFIQI